MDDNLLKAYAEVNKILSYMENVYVEKIPIELRELFENEKLKDYNPEIDVNIPLDEQNLQRKTLAILTMLHLNYWCENETEKQELLEIYAQNDKKREEELLEKYNPDNIFKKKDVSQEKNTENTAIIEYKKDNFFKKILGKIRSLFRKIK